MPTVEEVATIIWQEHGRWNGAPAPSREQTWGWKAAERIVKAIEQPDFTTMALALISELDSRGAFMRSEKFSFFKFDKATAVDCLRKAWEASQ